MIYALYFFCNIFNIYKYYKMKFNNETLRDAVAAWIANSQQTTTTYGDMSTWDVSQVTDFSALFKGIGYGVGIDGLR